MSLLNLLSLEDDQIEIVTDAVRRWCEENRLDINSETGREAMDVAVRIVTCPSKGQFGLPGALAKEMASRDGGHVDHGE